MSGPRLNYFLILPFLSADVLGSCLIELLGFLAFGKSELLPVPVADNSC